MTSRAKASTAADGIPAKEDSARARIIDAAANLFALKGYKTTSIDAIADAAEVSRGLIFWHFDSKEGLLWAVLEKTSSGFLAEIADAIGERRGLEALRELIALRSQLAELRGWILKLFFMVAAELPNFEDDARPRLMDLDRNLSAQLAEWLRQAQADGEIASGLDPDQLAVVVLSTFHGNTVQWSLDPDHFSLGDADRMLLDVLGHLGPAR